MLEPHWTDEQVLTRQRNVATTAKSQQYISKSVHCFRHVSACSELPKKRHNSGSASQARHCCEHMKTLKKSALDNHGCETNKNVQPIIASLRNLAARDASGHQRVSYLLITPKISNKYNNTVYEASSDSISRKENCSRVSKPVIRDMGIRHLEFGIYFPTSTDWAALRLAESRKIAQLASNPYLNQSAVFREKVKKIEEKKDRYRTAYPNPAQILSYSQYLFLKLKNGEWRSDEFFATPGPVRIYDRNWAWRHHSTMSARSAGRFGHVTLPPFMQMMRDVEANFSWQPFLGSAPENEANRQLRDRIVTRLLQNIESEIPVVVDNEQQLEYAIQSEFGGPEHESYYSQLDDSNALLRAPSCPTNLVDLEFSLQASRDTEAKYLEKRGENMVKRTAYRGESRENFPYFWSTVFKNNCNEESSLNINLSSGTRQVSPICHYLDEALIDPASDTPETYAAPLYPKDMKMASLSLQAVSYGLALGKNRTAALVSRQEYCQKVPLTTPQQPHPYQPPGPRSCQSEGMLPCYKCSRCEILFMKGWGGGGGGKR